MGAVQAESPGAGWRLRVGTWTSRPLYNFYAIVSLTGLLTTFGLMMVLSSSSVESYRNSHNPYARFLPQVGYAIIGAVLFVAMVRIPTRLIRRAAPWLLVAALGLLTAVLIPGIGQEQMGSRSWIFIAGLSFQPSEFGKIALTAWTAHIVAAHIAQRRNVNQALPVVVGVSLLVLFVTVLQKDLGQTITLGVIFMAVLWFGLFKARTFFAIGAGCAAAFLVLGLTAGYRSDRIKAYLNPSLDPQGLNYQSIQAKYALAGGGLFGRGLGQSDSKWSYLPQSYNDFIFAIIGEELGMLGALAVVAIFAAILWIGLRISARSLDPFLKILTATATAWITVQALINISYVVGLLPVTGLQLPLVSAGGTSMLSTMVMFGLIAHAALREPEAAVAVRSASGQTWVTQVFGRLSNEERHSHPRRMHAPFRARPANATAPPRKRAPGAAPPSRKRGTGTGAPPRKRAPVPR